MKIYINIQIRLRFKFKRHSIKTNIEKKNSKGLLGQLRKLKFELLMITIALDLLNWAILIKRKSFYPLINFLRIKIIIFFAKNIGLLHIFMSWYQATKEVKNKNKYLYNEHVDYSGLVPSRCICLDCWRSWAEESLIRLHLDTAAWDDLFLCH